MVGTVDSPTHATMPLFELAVATAVLTLYGCFSCISTCSRGDDDRGHGHPYPASSTGYGSITTRPAHRPLPTPSYPRDRHIPSKPTVKTPLIRDHRGNFPHPTRSHIAQQPGPSRPLVVPHHTAALASPSSRDPHARTRPRERETIRRTPLASRSNLPVPQPDKDQEVEGIITGEDLRKHARHRKEEMQKANKLADRARRGGNRDARDRHGRDALVHKSAMESLNKAAARLTFKEKNKDLPKGTVDLHGLSVPEALEYAKEEFQSATLRADRAVRFIVGKGLHSEDGRAKIRPALEKLCDKRGYTHTLDPRNAGVLVVQC